MTQLAPFVHLLLEKIDQIQEKDSQEIFAEPVDFEEVTYCICYHFFFNILFFRCLTI